MDGLLAIIDEPTGVFLLRAKRIVDENKEELREQLPEVYRQAKLESEEAQQRQYESELRLDGMGGGVKAASAAWKETTGGEMGMGAAFGVSVQLNAMDQQQKEHREVVAKARKLERRRQNWGALEGLLL